MRIISITVIIILAALLVGIPPAGEYQYQSVHFTSLQKFNIILSIFFIIITNTIIATIITITTTTTIIVILAIGIIKGCPPGTGLSQGRSDERTSS